MRIRLALLALLFACPALIAQAALNNEGVLKLIKAGLSEDLIISTINASAGSYDTSANGIIALKSGGASEKILAAILTKSSGGSALSVTTPAAASQPAIGQYKLADGTDVPLAFDQDLSSKTAAEGDPVSLVLTEDLKVGDVIVAKAGSKAFGEVTNAKKSGMMGKAGELNIRVDYLLVNSAKVKLRGVKGKEGESGVTSTVVLTVLFGPIGLIKHGHNIDIKKGAPLKVYVSDDTFLPGLGKASAVSSKVS